MRLDSVSKRRFVRKRDEVPLLSGISAARPTSCLTPEELQILEIEEKEEKQEVKEHYEKYQKKLRWWEKKWTTTVISTKSIEIGKRYAPWRNLSKKLFNR